MKVRESKTTQAEIAKTFFIAVAFCTVVGFGASLLVEGIQGNAPEIAALEALERTKQFTRLGESWRPEWLLSDLESTPWKSRSTKSDVHGVDMTQGTVLINLWATWCEPCKAEFPSMVELARDEPDLTLVFVSYDETWAAQKDFLVQMFGVIPPGVVLLRDPKGQGQGNQSVDTLWHQLGATAVPETFIIRDGQILAKAIGGLNWKHPEIRKYLGLVLNKRGNVSCSITSRPDAGALWMLWGLLVLVVFRRVLARQMAR